MRRKAFRLKTKQEHFGTSVHCWNASAAEVLDVDAYYDLRTKVGRFDNKPRPTCQYIFLLPAIP